MKKPIAVLVLIACGVALDAQQRNASTTFPLTVDSIMRGPELVGYSPGDLRWSGASKELFFEWRMPKEDEAATWKIGRDGGQPQRLSDAERKVAPLPNGSWDADRRRILSVDRGDVVVIDTVAHTRIDVTRTTGGESSPRWARNGTHVTFVRDNNLFIAPVSGASTGTLVQLTDVATRRPDSRVTDSQKFVKQEERELLQWVEEEAARRQRREERDRANRPPRFEIGERETVVDAALLSGETFVFLVVAERAQSRNTEVPRYVSESAYAEEIPSRTKVGDAQERRRLAILNLATGEGVWAGLEGIAEPISIPKPVVGEPPAQGTPETKTPEPKPKRDVRWGTLLLSPDGHQAAASVRSLDNTDRWLVQIDPATGKTKILDVVHDEAWVREIGPSSNVTGGLGWLPDNKRVWFLAEHDGWMHLNTVDTTAERPERRQLTSGKFEIDAVELSRDGSTFYVRSTEVHPGERHLYAMKVDGGARTKLSSMTGAYDGAVAPDDSTFGVVYSAANKPPEVFLMPNRAGAQATQVTTSTNAEWRQYKWVEPQLITYKARDGVEVYARLYTPEMVGARRNPLNPAVVFVHGAGYTQNAHRYWASYYREYMFHHLLASKGYVVLDPDYRASAGYGRDWRTAIYRWMGGKDLEDVVDGAKYLATQHKVNPQRIGVYGGSYGGFITLMALFTSPDTFAAGAALRPVTDWAHYNHPYTSNILNEPQTDADAYRKSSPIYFADKLKGALLICHGMVDTNVHFQDSVRLVQRLIELKKENWELAVYPVEDHGFVEASSWADEYKRILKLFDQNLATGNGSRVRTSDVSKD
jgi:dipeptidyl aminopeptidase/acylaminoacyl peptidase